MYLTSDTKDEDQFLETCAVYLGLYTRSKEDALFQMIMDAVDTLEDGGMKFEEALALAILKYKKAIATKVNSCKQSGGDGELQLWCAFAEEDVKPWCKWHSGEKCTCKDCTNVVTRTRMVAFFAYIFHLIEEDSLAMEIAQKLEESKDFCGELIPTVEGYRKIRRCERDVNKL